MAVSSRRGGKLVGQTLRLAAVLHCVRNAFCDPTATPIDHESIKSAIKLARYLVPHAQQVLSELSSNDHTHQLAGRCQQAIDWIGRHQLRRFTRRELHQNVRAFKRQSPEALEPVLEELTQRGYIRPLETATSKPGRPRTRTYEVNPGVVGE